MDAITAGYGCTTAMVALGVWLSDRATLTIDVNGL